VPKYRFDEIAINSTEKKKPTETDKETYIGLEHLDSGILEVTRWGAEVAPVGDKLVMRKGDILFGRRRAYQKKVAIAPFDGIFSAHGMVLRPIETVISKEFFPFFISSDYFLDAAIQISVGSLSPTINWRDLCKLEFEIPTIEEQRELSPILWGMNRLKAAYSNLLQQMDALVQSQFVEMFINTCEYPTVHLNEVSVVTSGLTKNPNRPTFHRKMKYLRVANVLYDQIDLEDVQEIGVQDAEVEKASLHAGDVLFVEGNGSPDQIGRVAVWDGQMEPMLHQNHIIKARPDSGKVNPRYIMHYFMTTDGRNQILSSAKTTSGLYTLSLSKIAEFTIPLPPMEAQQSFIALVDQADKSKLAIQQALDSLEKSRNAIMKKVFG